MLAWKIALRYLFSKKSHGVVNVISIISVAGVAVATAAIVIVLSVFNGFTDLASSHLSAIDPELKVVPAQGKAFTNADSLASVIGQQRGVAKALPVIEERGLMMWGNAQMPVIFKGMPEGYGDIVDFTSVVIDGAYPADSAALPVALHEMPQAAVSVGTAIKLGIRPSMLGAVNLYVPRRVGRINPANPAASFRGETMLVTAVTEVQQPEYDNEYVFIPLASARKLLEYGTESTAIEVSLQPGASAAKVAKSIEEALGGTAKALTRHQQQADSFKMIMVEKWITFLMLAFILLIASFNIISTLSLLVIEKRDNMATLWALGAPLRMIRSIFVWQGWLITVTGGILGVILGAALSLAQQWGGFIRLSGDPSQLTIDAYPVHVQATDLLIVLGLVAIVALGISQITRLFISSKKYSNPNT